MCKFTLSLDSLSLNVPQMSRVRSLIFNEIQNWTGRSELEIYITHTGANWKYTLPITERTGNSVEKHFSECLQLKLIYITHTGLNWNFKLPISMFSKDFWEEKN